MTDYAASYGNDNNGGAPLHFTLTAATPTAAARALRRMVADGYRNQSWGAVDLCGATYTVRNVHGRARGRFTRH